MRALIDDLGLDASDVTSVTLEPTGIVATLLIRVDGRPIPTLDRQDAQTYSRTFPYEAE